MVPRKVAESHEGLNGVAIDTLHAIRQLRTADTNVVNDIISLLFKWSFECKCDRLLYINANGEKFNYICMLCIL